MADIRMEIKVNNIDKALAEKDVAISRALEIIGGKAQRYVSDLTPQKTGRLRGSMTYKTAKGGSSPAPPASGADGVQGNPTKSQVIIGTNVEYAAYVELGAQKRKAAHMIKRGVGDHVSEYENIIKSELDSISI